MALPYFYQAENVGKFFYTDQLFGKNKLLWMAEMKKDKQQIVVKYTYRYNKEAHELCYNIGKVPKLLYIRKTCGFYYVVMEYIDDKKLDDCDVEHSVYEKIIKDIKEAVKLLHSNDIIFTDLHDTNILVIQDENDEYHGMLVDFDWTDLNNVDSYPSLMNPDIKWPNGANDKMPLKK